MVEAVKKLEAVEAEPAKTTEIIVDLKKPVQAHGEMLKQLKFREPTGGDMVRFGDTWPVRFDAGGWAMPVPAAMEIVMSILAAVPPSTIKMMDGKDFSTCAFRLRSFFIPEEWV